MSEKFKGILSGVGFYTVLGLCVLAAAIGGYYLLLDDDEEIPVEAPLQTEVAAPAPEAEPPAVETTAPEPIEVETPAVAMPEITAPVDDTPVVAEAPRVVVSPLEGEIVSAFSVDQLVYNETMADWRIHDGIDISAQEGTSVLAASAGTVLDVTEDVLMGTTVTLQHSDGCQTIYANLQPQPPVSKGDAVSAGQIIGTVGTTAAAESAQGPHLHFSVTKDSDVLDPNEYLNQ